MRGFWEYGSPSRILFGLGAAEQLPSLAKEMGATKVAVITDRWLMEAGVAEPLIKALKNAGLATAVFDGGKPEPSVDLVHEGWRAIHSQMEPDLLVAIGGGSNIDVAKGVSILLRHGGDIGDYFGEDRVPGPAVPILSVSTTAGTGSEVSAVAVLDDTRRGTKVGISSHHIRPQASIYDPLLTVSCPPGVTAHSGIDALTHAIEAYTATEFRNVTPSSQARMTYQGKNPYTDTEFRNVTPSSQARMTYQGKNPYTDALALEAVRLLGMYLPRAVANGRDVEARERVHLGSLLAGLAFSNAGLGAVHALQLPIGALTKTPHGLGNGVLLPYVMEANLPARQREFYIIARELGERVEGLSEREGAQRAVAAVRRLRRDIGIPDTLASLGVKPEHLPQLAQTTVATQQRLLRYNPVALREQDIQGLLERALKGTYLYS